MRVLSLKIQNILSIEDSTIYFENTGLVLVEGWNYDTQRANGAGKTAIFNCLSFALYDKLPRNITASEILRRGCKTGFAEASIQCNEDVWTVRRSRPKGVIFSKNGVQQDITQVEFESFVRLTYQQFLLTIYTPQANSRELIRFLSSPDTSKKEFLLQLLNLDQFGTAKKEIDNLIKAHQASIDLEDKKLSITRSKVSAYEESLVDTASLQKQVDDFNSSIYSLDNKILEHSNIIKPDLSKYIKIEDDIRIKQSEIALSKARRHLLHDRYRELTSSLIEYKSDAACGECGTSLDTVKARETHTSHHENTKQKSVKIKEQIDASDIV